LTSFASFGAASENPPVGRAKLRVVIAFRGCMESDLAFRRFRLFEHLLQNLRDHLDLVVM
jgi:hypothetical protein